MAFDLKQEGTTIIIIKDTNGSYKDFAAAKNEIIRKEKSIVIENIIVSTNGINYPIENGFEVLKSSLSIEDILTPKTIASYENEAKDEIKRKIEEEEKKTKENEKKLQEINVQIDSARQKGDWSNISDEAREIALSDIVLTTSMFVANREIDYEFDVITYECAYGMNIFRDLFASVRDIVGGRSKAVETVLRDARVAAMRGIREEALDIGADAVIAIDLDYSELSGGGKGGMLVAIATGTAVKLKYNV